MGIQSNSSKYPFLPTLHGACVLPMFDGDAFRLVDVAAEEVRGLLVVDEIAHRGAIPACSLGGLGRARVP